ncbi:MAG: hypothetical protein ACI8ZB_005439 [Desulforhopalus sp.]
MVAYLAADGTAWPLRLRVGHRRIFFSFYILTDLLIFSYYLFDLIFLFLNMIRLVLDKNF